MQSTAYMRPTRRLTHTAGTIIAMLAFAANSILCRMALSENQIDASLFSLLRLISGALFLCTLVWVMSVITSSTISKPSPISPKAFIIQWLPPLALLTYVWGFSVAYQWLSAGTGALVLFGCVQLTLVALTLAGGEKVSGREYIGVVMASAGLFYLLHSHIGEATGMGYILMAVAGIAWGGYTFLGKSAVDPIKTTANNFTRASLLIGIAVPFLFLATPFDISTQTSSKGVALAIISGAITSGGGYALWYAVIKNLSVITSGVAQLTVPLITTIAGTFFLDEKFTLSLLISTIMILGGVYLSQLRAKHTAGDTQV